MSVYRTIGPLVSYAFTSLVSDNLNLAIPIPSFRIIKFGLTVYFAQNEKAGCMLYIFFRFYATTFFGANVGNFSPETKRLISATLMSVSGLIRHLGY